LSGRRGARGISAPPRGSDNFPIIKGEKPLVGLSRANRRERADCELKRHAIVHLSARSRARPAAASTASNCRRTRSATWSVLSPRSGLFSLRIPEFESDQPGILNNPAVMLFSFPRRQCLPKSLRELHIPSAAARTRKVSAAQFQPNRRKFRRPLGQILILTDSGVRVLPPQPRSWSLGAVNETPPVCGCAKWLPPLVFCRRSSRAGESQPHPALRECHLSSDLSVMPPRQAQLTGGDRPRARLAARAAGSDDQEVVRG
jgi:hypothetical protein